MSFESLLGVNEMMRAKYSALRLGYAMLLLFSCLSRVWLLQPHEL